MTTLEPFPKHECPALKSKIQDSLNMYSGANTSFTMVSEAQCLPVEFRGMYKECKLGRHVINGNTLDYIVLSNTQVNLKYPILYIGPIS